MEVIRNFNSAKAQRIYKMGKMRVATQLNQCYANYSKEKERAFNYCYDQYCNDLNSDTFGICSYNRFGFSCSWFFDYVCPRTGEVFRALRVETPKNSYCLLLPD